MNKPVAARRIFVAGHRGMVGSAIVRALRAAGYRDILVRERSALDLTEQAAVRRFFEQERPAWVFLAAARVGGIQANNLLRADFLVENVLIETNVMQAAQRAGCERLLFLGSSCIYPKFATQPIPESALLTGALEPTNQPYAIAKIAGIEMCDAYNRQYGTDFRAAMPTNLYGPGDNFDLMHSHVIPALLRKFHDAKKVASPEVTVWGTGSPLREFLHVDDLARACVFLMELPREQWARLGSTHINVGHGTEISIAGLARLIAEIVGYQGRIVFDTTKPDGTPRKLLDSRRLRELGWRPVIDLPSGLRETYAWYLRQENFRGK